MNHAILMEITGWSGSAMVVIAYMLNILGKIKSQSALYIWLNIAGSVCLIAYTFYLQAYPNTVVNLVWVLVAVYSLFRSTVKKTV